MKMHYMGFFRELPHGLEDGPSLHDGDRSPYENETEIVEYLTNAPIVAASGEAVYDVLGPEGVASGSNDIRTDGTWMWPDDLAFYVRTYHLRLPAEFIQHGGSRGWQVPVLSRDDLLRVEEEVFSE